MLEKKGPPYDTINATQNSRLVQASEHKLSEIVNPPSDLHARIYYNYLSPSWEAASCAAIRELPNILQDPKGHCRVHDIPPLVLILSQIDPIPTTPSYLSKIYLDIIHPPASWSS
jgi:hypothetical protein